MSSQSTHSPTEEHATADGGNGHCRGADPLADPVGVRKRIGYVPQAIGVTADGTDPNCA